MDRAAAIRFAEEWIDHWNRRDLEAVLVHFDEHVLYTSPTANRAVGRATVHGKAALLQYWVTVLAPVKALSFALERVAWDPETRELAIFYDRDLEGELTRVVAVLTFDAGGKVVWGEAFYGLVPRHGA